jgi:hypothetical protein
VNLCTVKLNPIWPTSFEWHDSRLLRLNRLDKAPINHPVPVSAGFLGRAARSAVCFKDLFATPERSALLQAIPTTPNNLTRRVYG